MKISFMSQQLNSIEMIEENLLEITEFFIYNNQFKEIPLIVLDMRNLEVLNISVNKITKLPDNIGYLSKLKNIDFGHNLLSQLPNSFRRLVSLEDYVYLYDNQFEVLPEWFGELNKVFKY